eukprot:379682-Rhodomonas_salina.1
MWLGQALPVKVGLGLQKRTSKWRNLNSARSRCQLPVSPRPLVTGTHPGCRNTAPHCHLHPALAAQAAVAP